MTATAATAAATSQELSISGKAPGPSRAGIKYPVQESLTSIKTVIHSDIDMFRDLNLAPPVFDGSSPNQNPADGV